jgi:tetratricopeptide (TPR) repeat protein
MRANGLSSRRERSRTGAKLAVVLASAALTAAALGAASCAQVAHPGESPSAPPDPPKASAQQPTSAADALGATLPGGPPRFAPSHVEIAGGASIPGTALTDIDTCDQCHADIAMQWRTSAHSFASFNNPIYRVSVDRMRADVNNVKSRFCGGCHDIALLMDGAMDAEIAPADRRAHAGITCKTCHSIELTRPDGNGSYTLTAQPIPMPVAGDPSTIKPHLDRVALGALRTAGLCISCHKAFLDDGSGNAHHMTGQDDATPWQRSEFAGSRVHRVDDPVAEAECRTCHMPMEDAPLGDAAATNGKVASHRFLGAHTWLAAMRGDADQKRRTQEMLRGSVSIDIAAAVHEDGSRTLPADGARVTPGERVVLDVVLRSLRVGHRFPGGVIDAADAWIEVTVHDARGKLLAEAGTAHEASGADPTAHRLRSLLAGEDGEPLLERQTHKFRALVFNHSIPPREAAVAEYALDVPASLDRAALPLRVKARLLHRTRNLTLQRLACADAKTPRGRAFRAADPRSDLDPCVAQPVTEIAEAEVWIGEGAEARREKAPARPAWRRLYDHALGLSGALQERLDEGRPSLARALEDLTGTPGTPAAPAAATDYERAMVLGAMANLAARQGRIDEALALVARAEPLAPGHPALAELRGRANALVWRWPEAAAPLATAAEKAPGDDSVWSALALARGSAGDARGALIAARTGLKVQPRDHDLLRVQALSLDALGGAPEEVAAAYQAYLAVQPADMIPRVRAKCSAKVPGCAHERNPVHVHVLRIVR